MERREALGFRAMHAKDEQGAVENRRPPVCSLEISPALTRAKR